MRAGTCYWCSTAISIPLYTPPSLLGARGVCGCISSCTHGNILTNSHPIAETTRSKPPSKRSASSNSFPENGGWNFPSFMVTFSAKCSSIDSGNAFRCSGTVSGARQSGKPRNLDSGTTNSTSARVGQVRGRVSPGQPPVSRRESCIAEVVNTEKRVIHRASHCGLP